MMEAKHCANCSRPMDGGEQKFCPACGQPTPAHRIDWHFLGHELEHSILHMDRGVLYTIKNLMLRPGHLMRDYLGGKREGIVKPLLFLMMTAGALLFVSHMMGSEPMSAEAAFQESDGQRRLREAIVLWMNKNFALVTLLLLPIEAAAFKLAFRKFREVNYTEWLVMVSYLTAFTSLVWIVMSLVKRWFAPGLFELTIMVLVFGYMIGSLIQFFSGHPRWKIVVRSLFGLFVYLVGYFVFFQVVALVIVLLVKTGRMAIPA